MRRRMTTSCARVAASVAWELWVSGMPEVILVGADYPVADLDQSQGIRFRDMTPSEDRAAISAMSRGLRYAFRLWPPTGKGD